MEVKSYTDDLAHLLIRYASRIRHLEISAMSLPQHRSKGYELLECTMPSLRSLELMDSYFIPGILPLMEQFFLSHIHQLQHLRTSVIPVSFHESNPHATLSLTSLKVFTQHSRMKDVPAFLLNCPALESADIGLGSADQEALETDLTPIPLHRLHTLKMRVADHDPRFLLHRIQAPVLKVVEVFLSEWINRATLESILRLYRMDHSNSNVEISMTWVGVTLTSPLTSVTLGGGDLQTPEPFLDKALVSVFADHMFTGNLEASGISCTILSGSLPRVASRVEELWFREGNLDFRRLAVKDKRSGSSDTPARWVFPALRTLVLCRFIPREHTEHLYETLRKRRGPAGRALSGGTPAPPVALRFVEPLGDDISAAVTRLLPMVESITVDGGHVEGHAS